MSALDSLQMTLVPNSKKVAVNSEIFSEPTPSITSVIWASLDFLTAIAGGVIASQIRLHRISFTGFVPYLILFGIYLIFCCHAHGLYTVSHYQNSLREQRESVQATFTAGLLLCGSLYVLHKDPASRRTIALTVLFTLIMQMLRRFAWHKLRVRRYLLGLETRNILIVGQGPVAHALRSHLQALKHMGFRFKGFVSEADTYDQLNKDIIGNLQNCVALARSLFVDEIYFSTSTDNKIITKVVEQAKTLRIEVRVVPDLYDGLAWNSQIEYIGGFPTILLHRREFSRRSFLLKRILDVSLSLLVVLLTLPLMIGIAIMVKLGSKGPVLYRAKRVGRKGRPFLCYKFRTMVVDADRLQKDLTHLNERQGIMFKISNDPRITRVGGFLRRYSIDELPQLFNVLLDDMSLVGPRPPIAAEVEQYEIAHLRRLDVLPGITGLWQVEARQDPSFDSYISLDTAYVENWNLWLDLQILIRTVGAVFRGTGS